MNELLDSIEGTVQLRYERPVENQNETPLLLRSTVTCSVRESTENDSTWLNGSDRYNVGIEAGSCFTARSERCEEAVLGGKRDEVS